MKTLISLVLALSLAACATSIQNPISTTNLYQGEVVFSASIKTFNELKALCINHILPNSCRTYVINGQGLIRKAYAADVAARGFIKNNPTLDATTVVQAFTSVVTTFSTTVASLSAAK